MKGLILVVVGFSILSQAQQKPVATAAPTHFRWSEVESHELDYKRTIKTSPELSPKDKTALANAVLLQLKRDPELKEDLEDLTKRQLQSLVEDTRVEMRDLDGEGEPEIIAQANGLGPCGGTGNCIFWIFKRTPEGLKLLLNTDDVSHVTFEKILIRPWSTNGYRDIVLDSHSNASSRNIVWFQFANGAYHIHSCYYSTWMGDDGQALKTPALWKEACSKSLWPIR